jgi:hypothetical protein
VSIIKELTHLSKEMDGETSSCPNNIKDSNHNIATQNIQNTKNKGKAAFLRIRDVGTTCRIHNEKKTIWK